MSGLIRLRDLAWERKKERWDKEGEDGLGSNLSPGKIHPGYMCEHHLPKPLQIYDGIINNNKFVVNLYRAK